MPSSHSGCRTSNFAVGSSPEMARPMWSKEEVLDLLSMPFNDLLFRAHNVHRTHFDANQIQVSQLFSIKTGGCSEDCAYCPQSTHHDTELSPQQLASVEKVVEMAQKAKENGATRFCMGAAWRSPDGNGFTTALAMVRAVKALGIEACASFGLLTFQQALQLKEAGLDYYNHNVDTSKEYYPSIVTSHSYEERLTTIHNVRSAGIKVCSGGIIGLGEENQDRADMLITLANLPQPPESVPINMLIPISGTPLEEKETPDPLEFVRVIATARIMMPKSFIRLSAGREQMSDELQAWCFFAGANSVFCGDKLLTAKNKTLKEDQTLFKRLGLKTIS